MPKVAAWTDNDFRLEGQIGTFLRHIKEVDFIIFDQHPSQSLIRATISKSRSFPFLSLSLMATEKSLDALLDERLQLQNGEAKGHIPNTDNSQHEEPTASAALPPGMQRMKEYSVDELLKEMNRVPLFMTSLEETDGEGGENMELEALKALAYEGTRAEIAQNFREQGSEIVRTEKRYTEAREYYTKALQALNAPPQPPDPEQGPKVVEIDEEAEAEKERAIEEVCLVNRALCNLEMSISAQ